MCSAKLRRRPPAAVRVGCQVRTKLPQRSHSKQQRAERLKVGAALSAHELTPTKEGLPRSCRNVNTLTKAAARQGPYEQALESGPADLDTGSNCTTVLPRPKLVHYDNSDVVRGG